MMRWLVNRIFDEAKRRYDYDVSYMRATYDASPKACMRFDKVGLGFAKSCGPIRIGSATVAPAVRQVAGGS